MIKLDIFNVDILLIVHPNPTFSNMKMQKIKIKILCSSETQTVDTGTCLPQMLKLEKCRLEYCMIVLRYQTSISMNRHPCNFGTNVKLECICGLQKVEG